MMWTKQGTKKVTQDDSVVIEVEEPARGKTLSMVRRIAIPPRQYAEFELECDELEGKIKIKLEPFLQQREPNLWMESFVVYNVPGDKEEVDMKEEIKKWEMPIRNEDLKIVSNETREETKRVHIPYCIFNLIYVNHSYIPKGRIIAFLQRRKKKKKMKSSK